MTKYTLWWANPEEVEEGYRNLSVSNPGLRMETEGWVKLQDIEVLWPSKDSIAPLVVERLQEQQRRVRIRAEETVAAIEKQLQQFLALEGPEATLKAQEGEDDIPF